MGSHDEHPNTRLYWLIFTIISLTASSRSKSSFKYGNYATELSAATIGSIGLLCDTDY